MQLLRLYQGIESINNEQNFLKLSGIRQQAVTPLPVKRQKSRGKKSGRSKLLISAPGCWGECCRRLGYRLRQEGTTVRASIMAREQGTGWVAIGEDAKANSFTDTGGGSSTAVGYHSTADGRWSTALGAKTHSLGEASVALGINTTSAGERSLAIGASATSTGGFSIALGQLCELSR